MTHENLKAAYEEDAKRTEKPYLLWQVRVGGVWKRLNSYPAWAPNLHYRRHPHADSILFALTYPHLEWQYRFLRHDRELCDGWKTCGGSPVWGVDREYRIKPSPLQAPYDADKHDYTLWQYKAGGKWLTCQQPPDFYSQVEYRRHPHADKMLAYREGEQWEWYSNGVWRRCHSTPEWHHDLDYRRNQ